MWSIIQNDTKNKEKSPSKVKEKQANKQTINKQKATNKQKLNNSKNKNEEKKCKKVRLWDLSDHAIHTQQIIPEDLNGL